MMCFKYYDAVTNKSSSRSGEINCENNYPLYQLITYNVWLFPWSYTVYAVPPPH